MHFKITEIEGKKYIETFSKRNMMLTYDDIEKSASELSISEDDYIRIKKESLVYESNEKGYQRVKWLNLFS